MSFLPKCKADLRQYLAGVDEEVEKRKGKLPFFNLKKVRGLILRGDGEKLNWTKAANSEFRLIEICTEIGYQEEAKAPSLEAPSVEAEVTSPSWQYVPDWPGEDPNYYSDNDDFHRCCSLTVEFSDEYLQMMEAVLATRGQRQMEVFKVLVQP